MYLHLSKFISIKCVYSFLLLYLLFMFQYIFIFKLIIIIIATQCNTLLPILLPPSPGNSQVYLCYTLAEADIKNILTATGKEFDAAQVSAVIDNLKGKALHEVLSVFNVVDQQWP